MEKKFKCKDEVIYRCTDKYGIPIWSYGIFSHYYKGKDIIYAKIVGEIGIDITKWEILPYEGNEHLVGSQDEPDEEVRLEEGEWVIYIIGEDNFQKWAIGKFDSLDNPITGERKFQMKPISEKAGYYCVSEKVVKFSDFNPNDMEETRKHILCVKNGRIIRYKG